MAENERKSKRDCTTARRLLKSAGCAGGPLVVNPRGETRWDVCDSEETKVRTALEPDDLVVAPAKSDLLDELLEQRFSVPPEERQEIDHPLLQRMVRVQGALQHPGVPPGGLGAARL